MEIEAKYVITGTITPVTIDQIDLSPYTHRFDQDLQQFDLVLDTNERTISRSGQGLRLRNANGKQILTFKGPNAVQGGIHRHEEIEVALPSPHAYGMPDDRYDTFDISAWPAVIAERVVSLIDAQARLQPLLEIRVHRQTWRIERDDIQIGELAFDQGVILADGHSELIYELEFELKERGKEADLEILDQRLRHQLPLTTQPLSKRQRGLALLDLDESSR